MKKMFVKNSDCVASSFGRTLAHSSLAALLLVGFTGFVACSDDDDDAPAPGGTEPAVEEILPYTSNLTVTTNPGEDIISITNYGAAQKAGTRAEGEEATTTEAAKKYVVDGVTHKASVRLFDSKISATCVQLDGSGDIYVSAHDWDSEISATDQIKGSIAKLAWTEQGALETKAVISDDAADYNHIYVDGDRILVGGHTESKGGIIGSIALSSIESQGAALRYTTVKGNRVQHADDPEFYAGDVNCIVRCGEKILVASSGTAKTANQDGTTSTTKCGGFSTLNNDLSRLTPDAGALKVAGSAKHIAVIGENNQKVVTLNLDGTGDNYANVNIYDYAESFTWQNGKSIVESKDEVNVEPVNGKNVVAVDQTNGDIYVCYGRYGLKRYSKDSSKDSGYASVARMYQYVVNAVAIGQKHVYVAAGGGLRIFTKDQLKGGSSPENVVNPTPVAEFRYKDTQITDEHNRTRTPSCNYVTVKENNGVATIYLAYGLDGVEVVTFNL